MKVDFVPLRLKNHWVYARMDLGILKAYHLESELIWAEKKEEVQRCMNEIPEACSAEDQENILEDYSWSLSNYDNNFVNTHRKSLLITIFSYLETALNQICDDVSKSIIGNNLKPKPPKGTGIRQSHLYLIKVAKFDWSHLTNDWNYIQNVRKLRNNIVHNGGLLPKKSEDELSIFVKENSNLSESPDKYVILSFDFIIEVLKKLKEFFEKLNKEILRFIENVSFNLFPENVNHG